MIQLTSCRNIGTFSSRGPLEVYRFETMAQCIASRWQGGRGRPPLHKLCALAGLLGIGLGGGSRTFLQRVDLIHGRTCEPLG